nr:unnamed protein product [Callosobruchus analis]
MNDQILGLLDGDYTVYLSDDSVETEDDEFTKLQQENEDLKEENKALKNRPETIDRKLRKYNIVVYGLKEESEHKDIKQVLQTFNEILGVRCTETDFRDCHRIGTAQSRQTASDYHNRKHLFSNLKLANSLNLDAKIDKNYLKIGDTKFTVEFMKKSTTDAITEAFQSTTKAHRSFVQGVSSTPSSFEITINNSGCESEGSKFTTLEEVEKWLGTKRKQPWNPEGFKPKRSVRLNSNKGD